ncbi:MAG: hypothetical protein BWY56_02263 [Acidobacteria bacterium ADurb.Bin340]|nr:MAG: hypothetical protein BWY56_02263 [Acidobacteria bacterium ADurb.Bin340]
MPLPCCSECRHYGELDEIPMEFQGGFCRYEEAAPRSTGEADRGWL